MAMQPRVSIFSPETKMTSFSCRTLLTSLHSSVSVYPSHAKMKSQLFERKRKEGVVYGGKGRRRRENGVVLASSDVAVWESWKPEKASCAPSLSDVLWPAAGAFAAMAIFGKMDQILASKGISMTIAPFGAVCAVLFTTPSAPAARLGCISLRKYILQSLACRMLEDICKMFSNININPFKILLLLEEFDLQQHSIFAASRNTICSWPK